MTKRDVVRCILEGKRPPYVPWSIGMTQEARQKVRGFFGCDDPEVPLENILAFVEILHRQPGYSG